MTTTIKITELTNIGANLSSSTVFPVVNMAGTPTTEKTVLANIANVIFAGAGTTYVSVALATTANTVAGANVTGQVGYAAVANSMAGSNVFGAVGSAGTANTVTTNAQPNITSMGNLTGLTVSNATGIVNFSNTANVTLGNVSNLHIAGGTAGQLLSTNGNGTLSWASDTTTYGNSNVVTLLSAFGSNTITTTGNITGGNINIPNGYANITGTANVVGGGATVGVRSILAIDSAFGSNSSADPASAQAVRGRVTGANLTKTRNYVTGVTGQYLITGTNASEFIKAGVLGVVGDQTTTADGAVVAYLDGDGGLTTANAAYAVSMKNSTPNSGFNYGLDLQFIDLNLGGVTTSTFKQADIRFNNGVKLVANTANNISINANVTVGNIIATNIGNIATINLDGNSSNVLRGDGTFAADANSSYGNSNVVSLMTAFGSNTITTTGNVSVGNIIGNGQALTNIAGANVSGFVANANIANTAYAVAGANVSGFVANANIANTAYAVAGANVSGFVANANVANTAYAVAGANVSGFVANANVANTAYAVAGANVSGFVANANVANTAYAVAAANVSGLGNIATINLTGSNSNVLYGNGVFAVVAGGANTGNVTFDDQAVVGTGDSVGSGGLYLAPGNTSVGNLQYLRVRGGDVATHIHFDTGNNGYFDQYFGDDGKYVKLESGGNISIGTNTHIWAFDTTGNLTLPDTTSVLANVSITLGANDTGNITGLSLFGDSHANLYAHGNITLYANTGGAGSTWTFDNSGNLTLPANAFAINYANGTQVALGGGGNTDWANIGNINNANGPTEIAIGYEAGNISQGDYAVAIGWSAGANTQGTEAVAIGDEAGKTSQGQFAVAVGYGAGSDTQGEAAVAVGYGAGQINQGNNSIILNATGSALDQTTADTFTVAPVRNDVANIAEVVFYNTTSKEVTYGNTISVAGNITAGNISTGVITLTYGAVIRDTTGNAVAFGEGAGTTSQGASAVAIGKDAGTTSQGGGAVAVGNEAGLTTQGQAAVAVGILAGTTSQGTAAVAVGSGAGANTQGSYAVAVGYNAGRTAQATNSIILNATGANLNQTTANTFTVKPVRGDSTANLTGAGFKGVYYNPTTGEFCYSTD